MIYRFCRAIKFAVSLYKPIFDPVPICDIGYGLSVFLPMFMVKSGSDFCFAALRVWMDSFGATMLW